MQHFHSATNITPPVLEVTVHNEGTSPGYLFSAPYAGPGASGPMIFDESGNLVWFHPLPWQLDATNLQVQQYGPGQVLTWWQGMVTPQGFGQGEEVIVNNAYQQVGRVHAGNGYLADLHEFKITNHGTALFTVFEPIECDLSSSAVPTAGRSPTPPSRKWTSPPAWCAANGRASTTSASANRIRRPPTRTPNGPSTTST